MHPATLVGIGWVAHAVGWLIAVVRRHGQIAYSSEWKRELLLRLAMVLLIIASIARPTLAVSTAGVIGLMLFSSGNALAVVSRWRMGTSWGIGVRPHTRATDDALFRRLRHPIYLGTTVAIVGQCLALQNAASLALLAGALAVIPIKILRERAWLRRVT